MSNATTSSREPTLDLAEKNARCPSPHSLSQSASNNLGKLAAQTLLAELPA